MAKTDKDGRFVIKNLPEGEHVFRLWHERAGYLRNVRFGGHVSDSRGRLTVRIDEGITRLGNVRLSPTLFE